MVDQSLFSAEHHPGTAQEIPASLLPTVISACSVPKLSSSSCVCRHQDSLPDSLPGVDLNSGIQPAPKPPMYCDDHPIQTTLNLYETHFVPSYPTDMTAKFVCETWFPAFNHV